MQSMQLYYNAHTVFGENWTFHTKEASFLVEQVERSFDLICFWLRNLLDLT